MAVFRLFSALSRPADRASLKPDLSRGIRAMVAFMAPLLLAAQNIAIVDVRGDYRLRPGAVGGHLFLAGLGARMLPAVPRRGAARQPRLPARTCRPVGAGRQLRRRSRRRQAARRGQQQHSFLLAPTHERRPEGGASRSCAGRHPRERQTAAHARTEPPRAPPHARQTARAAGAGRFRATCRRRPRRPGRQRRARRRS